MVFFFKFFKNILYSATNQFFKSFIHSRLEHYICLLILQHIGLCHPTYSIVCNLFFFNRFVKWTTRCENQEIVNIRKIKKKVMTKNFNLQEKWVSAWVYRTCTSELVYNIFTNNWRAKIFHKNATLFRNFVNYFIL